MYIQVNVSIIKHQECYAIARARQPSLRPSIELVKSVKVHSRGTKVVAWERGGVGDPPRSRGLARTKLRL
jgi:hypothetical protein